jgi:hydroxymethylbilane synthase
VTTLRLGTRASRLALAQSHTVAGLLRRAHPGLDVVIVEVTTQGDRDQSTPLNQPQQGTGWFTSALQDALLRDEADIAVHSYKDLPTARPAGLSIAAVPLREDPRDAFVSRSGRALRDLPAGAVVGTSSPRREAQVLEIRPDVVIRPIRGNVETRLAKVESGEFDATVLALAGLKRLGLEGRVSEVFGLYDVLPAPAQGALAIECRTGDGATREILAAIDDPALRRIVTAERSFLARLEAGCSFPSGAYAEEFGSTLKLHALVAPEGRVVRSKMAGPAETAAGLGRQLAEELMALSGMA